MRTLLFSLLFSSFATLSIQARSLHVLAWDQNIAKRKLAIASGSKSESIERMHHFSRSKAIKIPQESGTLKLVTEDRFAEDGKPLFLPLEIGPAIKSPLLLVIPDKKSPTGIKTLIIEDSMDNFEWGTMRFINVTGEDLVFRHEKKNKLIPSGWKPTDVAPKGKTRSIGVTFYLRKNLKLPPLYSSIWKHRPDLRKLVFIMPSKDKTRGLVAFKFIVQNKAAVAAEQKNAAKNE